MAEYYLVDDSSYGYGITFIPADDFSSMFKIVDNKPYVIENHDDNGWHPYSGGLDTYLQSCSSNHTRSCGRWRGTFDSPIKVLGYYRLLN
jgi:hypothetical protein